jgi:hypothetical protein
VDGEWNSGRMLPELTRYGAGALTSSKYFGEAGLDALRAMLMHADHYGLKWVFVRDHYYDPLLSFAGWRPVDNLEDKTITVWSKDGVPPATPVNAPQIPPHWQGLMWGILPVRQQPAGDTGGSDSGKKTLESAGRAAPAHCTDENLVHGRLVS